MMAAKRITLGYRMIETLNRKFDEFDRDKNGVLSLDEILEMSDTDEKDAKQIMDHFDMNGDDQVEREEFKHVGLLLLSNQQFKSYDADKDGVLSFAEFSAALKTLGYEDAQVQKVFKRADMDGSGSIDRFEFLNALLHMISPQNVDADSSMDVSSAWRTEEKRIRKSEGGATSADADTGDDDDTGAASPPAPAPPLPVKGSTSTAATTAAAA